MGGKVSSSKSPCVRHRTVTLRDPAAKANIGTARTSKTGAWKLIASPTSPVIAKVAKRVKLHSGKKLGCQKARTPQTDVTPPAVEILSPTGQDPTGPTGTVIYTVSEPVTVACTLDGGPVNCDASGFAWGPLDDGSHTLVITATDAAGNSTAASRTWFVDGSPPQVTSVTSASTGTGAGHIDFTLSDASDIVEIHCVIDGSDSAACGSGTSGTFEYTGRTPGASHIEIYGVDLLGNSGQSFAPSTVAPAPRVRLDWTVTG